ncbi:hypothetical protein ACMD2_25810 [Ananas comosus]|uniref:Uncharacterized protein n=1 Tax=Ananas comosus TaxID=4615 RepID=A0A199VX30_ANACO|nr:hypothetical protein ACMD2_25810 [Ananas comosus]
MRFALMEGVAGGSSGTMIYFDTRINEKKYSSQSYTVRAQKEKKDSLQSYTVRAQNEKKYPSQVLVNVDIDSFQIYTIGA